jgi:hypothetical protein
MKEGEEEEECEEEEKEEDLGFGRTLVLSSDGLRLVGDY